MTGRSHNVAGAGHHAGQAVRVSAAEELLIAYERLDDLIGRYPLRGIKGPVGTAADQLDLLRRRRRPSWPSWSGGSPPTSASHRVLTSVGQVYPRSLDFDVVSALAQAVAAPSSLATTIRLMVGQELATEGFKPGQVGSSRRCRTR